MLLSLPENPTTGYEWRAIFPVDLLEKRYELPSTLGLGASGVRTFTLIAGNAPHEILFEPMRAWLPEAPERRFRCFLEPSVPTGASSVH